MTIYRNLISSLILIMLTFFCVLWAAFDVVGTFMLAYFGIILFGQALFIEKYVCVAL